MSLLSLSLQRTPANATSGTNGAADDPRENGFGRKVQRADPFAVGEPARSLIPAGRDRIGAAANADPDE